MKLQKHQRLALHAVRQLCTGLEAHIHPAGKHPRLVVRYAGRVIQMAVASSPRCQEDVTRRTVREVRARLKACGVDLASRPT